MPITSYPERGEEYSLSVGLVLLKSSLARVLLIQIVCGLAVDWLAIKHVPFFVVSLFDEFVLIGDSAVGGKMQAVAPLVQ